jgi:hypothetical protein
MCLRAPLRLVRYERQARKKKKKFGKDNLNLMQNRELCEKIYQLNLSSN